MQAMQKAGLALCGVLAVVGVCILLFSTSADVGDASIAAPEPPPVEHIKPAAPADPEQPFVSPPAPESEYTRLNGTVLDVMDGVWHARERSDLAWLARTLEATATKDALDEDDLHAAHRQFTWRSTDMMWAKARECWESQNYHVVEEGDRAELVFQVGGALGELRIPFVRINNGWYFAHN